MPKVLIVKQPLNKNMKFRLNNSFKEWVILSQIYNSLKSVLNKTILGIYSHHQIQQVPILLHQIEELPIAISVNLMHLTDSVGIVQTLIRSDHLFHHHSLKINMINKKELKWNRNFVEFYRKNYNQ